ncbi:tRNA(Ile)-lysidine synthetase [Herbaspirillum sp. CF444]|uniref:tRNA lysidine(34) synthetase TilS n=1 Tax=Herbaspirillum sp. CF444 TaxID=1144319 RepID=UPI00027283A6|nr:tRNA lysidine(34) synthetase TilS [Herbaspirillum sp. CF444]EJL92228.1 tRNA(Ile)-lysidine synthetase [Herbaspirillum sp. CF444]
MSATSGAKFTLQQELTQALQALASAGRDAAAFATSFPAIAVAYSGGLDSSVLLHLAAAFAREQGVRLFAFHIHHGISVNADTWQAHCRQQCEQVGAVFDTRNIALKDFDKSGVEEAARIGRYHALGELCREHGIALLLTAHHQDDQAETILLQLLRGSGVAGMSGMDQANAAANLLGNDQLLLARPLLNASRATLEHYAAAQSLSFVDDESNNDTRYVRNALRHRIMPALAELFPGFQERFTRSASHAQSAQRLLVTLARQDLAACLDGEYLSVPALRKLDIDRIDNLLRHWFALRNLRMPSSAWLLELRTQLLEAKTDAQLCVTHPDCHIRRYRERVFLTPRRPAFDEHTEPLEFVWRGEERLHFPQFAGSLFFDAEEVGFNAAWLRGQHLSVRLRSGGERVKLAWNRPTKSVKYHYQAMDIPAWERPYLPMVFAGEQILYAAGIGMDCHAQRETIAGDSATQDARIALRWQADLS